jgi:hypothetical protein
VVIAAGTSGALASTASSGFFKTPSGKIVCGPATGGTPSAFVECGVSSGLKPPIPKTGHPECQHLNYVGNRIALSATGRVQLLPCAGDAGPFGDPADTVPVRYGTTKRIGGITCLVARNGVSCRNRSGHSFFLSLSSWRVF